MISVFRTITTVITRTADKATFIGRNFARRATNAMTNPDVRYVKKNVNVQNSDAGTY